MSRVSLTQAGSLVIALLLGCDGRSAAPAQREAPAVATTAHVVVTRVVAGWCGSCQVLAQHSDQLLPSELSQRVRYVDIVLADQDNAPATIASADAWRTTYAPYAQVSLDSELSIRALFSRGHRPLPWLVVQNEADDNVLATLANPTFELLKSTLEAALESEHGVRDRLLDERFDPFDVALINAMRLSESPPPDPTNAVADDPHAAELGRKLFFDRSLSPFNVSCGGCHDPALVLTDGKGVPPEGAGRGVRNAPSVALASRARWQLWDGRTDSLWAQALLPFEDINEFNSSRVFVARAVMSAYGAEYGALFGPPPDLRDSARFPVHGKPGEASWNAMAGEDRQTVTDVFVNVGKTLAAFERSIHVQPNALDRYIDGDLQALDEPQKDGLLAFLRAGCPQCHHGERLTDDAFHNLRFPTGHGDGSADLGRAAGIEQLAMAEFPRDPVRAAALNTPATVAAATAAFKTPGLRGAAFTLPFGHGGAYGGLASVIEAHRSCGLLAESTLTIGECEPWVSGFSPDDARAIESFLRALRLDYTGVVED